MQTRFEAEILVLHATGLSKAMLLTSMSTVLDERTLRWLSNAVHSRLSGMPLAYIIASVNFYGRDFLVGPGCLIPRPETEILVEEAVHWIQSRNRTLHVYDLGTGSGAISITIALECKGVQVEAVDISQDALGIASKNAIRLGTNISFLHTDGLKDLAQRVNNTNRIHVLVSNPPYIPTKDVALLDSDVRDYEPCMALDGGEDGLLYYRTILSIGDGFFVPEESAAVFFEVGIHQADILLSELKNGKYPFWNGWHFGVKNDLRGIPRVVFGERIFANPKETS